MNLVEGNPSIYPAPKPQELSQLARKIQLGETKWIREAVSKNPRLISTTNDGPTILQEGFRYNALHIAARYANIQVTAFVLASVSGTSFMRSLYPDDTAFISK